MSFDSHSLRLADAGFEAFTRDLSLEAAARHVDRAFKEGSCRFEWLHKRVDDGAVFPAEVLLVAMELEGERFLQAVVRDITTRHERDQMLEEFNTRLTRQVQSEIERRRRSEQALFRQARVATMGEMVSAISHHWRQPLSVIALSVQAIEEEYSEGLIDSERMAQLSYTCLNEIKKLSETLNMLRGMVPKSASHQSSIAEEIESVTRIVEPEFGAHHILLTAQTPSPSAACRPLPQEFRQVLFALLLNARDAILMQDKKSGWITVSVEKSEALETITIEDSGGGFCPEAIDRAFEPFFTTKERGRGSGVINGVGTGLYIAKLLIEEQMGGHITLENGPEGARVKLHLPC